MRRIIIMEVPLEGLQQALKLPKDAKIVDVRRPFCIDGVVEILVEHPTFPLVDDGHHIQRQKIGDRG